MSFVVQSVLFRHTGESSWTAAGARKWLRAHNYRAGKVDKTQNYFRFRQFKPAGGKYIIKSIGKGITLVLNQWKSK